MKFYLYLMVISLFVLVSCKSQQPRFEDYTGTYISLGNGGGFSGQYNGYYVFDDGLVFSFNSLSNEKLYFGKLDENVVKQFFANYDILNLKDKNINIPGNMNYFIEFNDGNHKFKSLWALENKDEQLSIFYKTLLDQISKLKEIK